MSNVIPPDQNRWTIFKALAPRYLVGMAMIPLLFAPLALLIPLLVPHLPPLPPKGSNAPLPPADVAINFLWPVYTIIVVIFSVSVGSGWRALAKRFPAPPGFEGGEVFKRQTASFGGNSYNRILTIGVASEGLFIHCGLLLRMMHPPLLIPWSEIRSIRFRKFLWLPTESLIVGSPMITLISLQNSDIQDAASHWLLSQGSCPTPPNSSPWS